MSPKTPKKRRPKKRPPEVTQTPAVSASEPTTPADEENSDGERPEEKPESDHTIDTPFTLESGYVVDPRGTAEVRKVAVEWVRGANGKFAGSNNGNPGNRGGQPGRSGRYPRSFKRFCREVLYDEHTQNMLRLAACSPTLPGYATIVKLLTERGFGPVEKRVAVDHQHRVLVSLDV